MEIKQKMSTKRIAHNLEFRDIWITPQRIKYGCLATNTKAILEFFGCETACYILGKQLGFYFDPKSYIICPEHISLQKDMDVFHGISMKLRSAESSEEALYHVSRKIVKGHPICIFAITWPLIVLQRESRIESFNPPDGDISYHTAILSGYDTSNDFFQLTDTRRFEDKFQGWFPRELILRAIGAEPLVYPNSWFEFSFDDNSFEIRTELCFQILQWNIRRMSATSDGTGRFAGYYGIRRFASELIKQKRYQPTGLGKIAYAWADQLLPILQQRDAHISFLKIVQDLCGLNFTEATTILNDNYILWSTARKLCYKFSRKGDSRILERIYSILVRLSKREQDLIDSLVAATPQF